MLLDDIATFLEAEGIGTIGTDLFTGDIPEEPDNCVALFEYSGQPPDVVVDIDYPGLQVRVRNTNYSAARAKIQDIFELLHTFTNTALSGAQYISIYAVQSPHPLGRDKKNRIDFVQNFMITKER